MNKEITSSKKIAKKARQILDKEQRRAMIKSAEEVGELLGNALKPKPWWVPRRVWKWGIGLFINIKKAK